MRKHYLIVGASRGIGFAVAEHLATTIHRISTASRSHCPIGNWIEADVTTDAGIKSIAESVGNEPLHALMYLGGCWESGAFTGDYHFLASSANETRNVINTNLVAPILIAQALTPNLAKAASARVILMGSESGLDNRASPEVAYSASKFGLRGVAQALTIEYEHSAISVSLINPGDVATPEVLADIDAGRMKTHGLIPLSAVIESIDTILQAPCEAVPGEINLIPPAFKN